MQINVKVIKRVGLMKKKNTFINVTASMGRGLLYAYLYIMFRPKICYQSRKAKEEIEKVVQGFKELNAGCIKGTDCSLFIKIMIKVVIFGVLALIF